MEEQPAEQPRSEHPRPQFFRESWMNLNGPWSCSISDRRPRESAVIDAAHAELPSGSETILVPFAPESRLSGIEHRDFIAAMSYHRVIEVPSMWTGRRILLHFGAVYYTAQVYIDGQRVGHHTGGSTPFRLDITDAVRPGGSHTLIVSVTNNLWGGAQASGKQSWKHESHGCYYTRTTGIWQTVWMEAVDPHGLDSVHILPDVDGGTFTFVPRFFGVAEGQYWSVQVRAPNSSTARIKARAADGVPATVKLERPCLWEPGDPQLYEIEYSVFDVSGGLVDKVTSYAGLRKIHVEGNRVFLNNRPLYQRLVLDQGFYPDGVWTAPSDEALRRDIELSTAAGFNGARLHQKAFEERFFYWADRLGYLCWAESPSWGLDYNSDGMPHRNFLAEWRELVVRDRNHPSIVAWTPFNETRELERPMSHARLHTDAYAVCKALDPTRPVNDASGYIHHITDLWTVHSYEQDPDRLAELLDPEGGVYRNFAQHEPEYSGQPYLIDEFGGIKWDPETQTDAAAAMGQNPTSWGYGKAPQSMEEFYKRLEGLVKAVVERRHICGWCYTQLTDVEQEQNGIYFYDRSAKFDMDRIRRIFQMPAPSYGQ